jgi:hypothetical protein
MLSTLRSLKFIVVASLGHSILSRLAMTGSVPWNVFSQDEVLQNSSMLRNSMPFVLADTRNWSAFSARTDARTN